MKKINFCLPILFGALFFSLHGASYDQLDDRTLIDSSTKIEDPFTTMDCDDEDEDIDSFIYDESEFEDEEELEDDDEEEDQY
jgi:hypothetical protein